MSRYAPTPEVMAIGQINISGNVTPATWWKYIRLPSGRPDATAIALLSEIVYWYRPTEVRDEHTGALLGYRKRFQGDKLQRSYQAFAEQFGFGKGNRRCAEASARCRVYYSGFTHGGNARWGEMQQYFVCRDQPTGNCGHHHTFFCFARK